MKYFICFLFFINSVTLFCQPFYTIPNASVQPTFVFPIFFEEGNGQKDTLYLGYDSAATGMGVTGTYDDTIYGVKPIPIDTNLFYVCWTNDLRKSFNPVVLKDSVYKTNVSKLIGSKFPGAYDIRMNSGILPLKISWDKILFYNDSLPFIINPPAPIGQSRFNVTFSNNEVETENGNIICQNWPYIIVTDTTVSSYCTAQDSMTIINLFSDSIPVRWGNLSFYIHQWSGLNVDIDKNTTQNARSIIYPNPFDDNFTISLNNIKNSYSIKIINLLGNLVYKNENLQGDTRVFTESFDKGMYIVEAESEQLILRHKVIKQ